MSDGEKETGTEVFSDYEEAFGTALALLEECTFAIGEEVYRAKRVAQKALEAWGQAENSPYTNYAESYARNIAARSAAKETHSEAYHFEAFCHDLVARFYEEKARRGQNPRAEIEAIFWKAQADIARQKAGHYPSQADAKEAFKAAQDQASTEAEDQAREDAEAEAIQKAFTQESVSSVPAVQAEETDEEETD